MKLLSDFSIQVDKVIHGKRPEIVLVKVLWIRGLVAMETVVLRRWGVDTIVWFINSVDNEK